MPRLDALQRRTKDLGLGLPIKLGLGFRKTEDDERKEIDRDVNLVRNDGGGFVESFVNWPNFISFSRMVSGPFLGW